MSSLLTKSQKVLPFVTLNKKLEIEELSPEPVAAVLLSSVTPMTVQKLESDFHPDKEKPSQVSAEP